MFTANDKAVAASDREIIATRLFKAPREIVWDAWTNPKHVVRWWGPHGFTRPSCRIDLRVGGYFNLDMRGPEGIIYPCTGKYREIIKPERIVFHGEAHECHPCGGGLPPRSVVTITFAESGKKTQLSMKTEFESVELIEAAVENGYNEGWAASLDHLEDFVASRNARE